MRQITITQYQTGKVNVYTCKQHIDETFTSFEITYDSLAQVDLVDFENKSDSATLSARTFKLKGQA